MKSLLQTDCTLFERRLECQSTGEVKEEAVQWLRERYAECLWLGETHSPLAGFINFVAFLYRSTFEDGCIRNALRTLLRSRSDIQRRLTGSASAAGLSDRAMLAALLQDTSSCQLYDEFELRTVKLALHSGAAQVVCSEIKTENGQGLGRFGCLWLEAIETRELQLQILVILCLLHYDGKQPAETSQTNSNHEQRSTVAADGGASTSSQVPSLNAEESPTQTRKRKRKVDTPHRWTGRAKVFPWQLQPRDAPMLSGQGSSDIFDLPNGKIDTGILAKQFEILVDNLCLRVATTVTSLDLQAREDEESAASSGNASQTYGLSPEAMARSRKGIESHTLVPPFGSLGRRMESEGDERDVLQWFCCQVVEAHFSRTLPRQCGIIRSRCFLVTGGATPSKGVRVTHSKSKGKDSSIIADIGRSQMPQKSHGNSNKSDDAPQKLSVQSKRHSITPEPGPLQMSLLKENRQTFKRTQSSAAAKRKNTFDAREVNVRRRWERSVSLGPTTNLPNDGDRAAEKEDTAASIPQRSCSTLVLDTPAKSRQVNILQARKSNADRFTLLPSLNVKRLVFPVKSENISSINRHHNGSLSPPSEGHALEGEKSRMEDEDCFSDLEDCGEELLDESLCAAFNEDLSDDEVLLGGAFDAYADWLGSDSSLRPLATDVKHEGSMPEQGEEEEKVVIAKHARARLYPAGYTVFGQQLSDSAMSATPPPFVSKSMDPMPVRNHPTGRNPFAVRQ